MASTKDKPTGSPAWGEMRKNAEASASGLLPGLLNDPAAYLAGAAERGGVITAQEVLPTGVVHTTFTFDRGGPSEYTEKVFTEEPFKTSDVAFELEPPNAPPIPTLPESENAVADALASTGVAPLSHGDLDADAADYHKAQEREDNVYYTEPLRAMLVARDLELEDEIAKLARLTESAMRAQSAVKNALSSLDRDGV